MTTYARISIDHLVDVVTQDPFELFHPDVAAQFIEVPDGAIVGATLVNGVWTNPTPEPQPAPIASCSILAPLDFYLAFTPAEREGIKTSTDKSVMEFWDTYQRCERANKPIDMNRPTVQQDLQYLVSVGIITADRLPQIFDGIPQ